MENAIPLIEELRKLHRYLKQEITDAINRIQTVAANLAYRVQACTSAHSEKRASTLKKIKLTFRNAKSATDMELQKSFPTLRTKKVR